MNNNLAYQEEFREELIGGEPVMMSPAFSNHNRIAGNIYRIFSNYLFKRKCEPFADGEDVYLTPEDRFVPDFMVVCDPEKVRHDGVHGAPDRAVSEPGRTVFPERRVRPALRAGPEAHERAGAGSGGDALPMHPVRRL